MTLLLVLGLFAGALTTVAGLGGGLVLLLALAVLIGPKAALATSALALLVGNLHRLWLYRDALDWPLARSLLRGVVPGAFFGALFLVGIPGWIVQVLMIAMVGLALARAFGGYTWVLPPRAMTASGAVIGALTATAGGAALLASPLLLASGLTGTAYSATLAMTSVGLHASRLVGYTSGGMYTTHVVAQAAVLAIAVMAGNLVGDRIRRHIGPRVQNALELGTPVVALGLALAGIT
jgi:uncharacterized membrane protein YfcA